MTTSVSSSTKSAAVIGAGFGGLALAIRLQSAGIACGPVLNNRDLLLDPHLRHRGFYERVLHPEPMGVRPLMGRPYRWTHRQPRVRHAAPAYAAHNREILRALPGYTDERVEALIGARTVCDTPHSALAPQAMGLAQLQMMRAIGEVDADYRERLGIASLACAGATKG